VGSSDRGRFTNGFFITAPAAPVRHRKKERPHAAAFRLQPAV